MVRAARGARFLIALANQSAIQLLRVRVAGAVRHVLHRPSASMVAVLMLKPASFATRARTEVTS